VGGLAYLGPVYPCRRTEAHAVPQCVYEDEDHADDVCGAVRVVRVRVTEGSVDLEDVSLARYLYGRSREKWSRS
jgi:hypothetical protein